METDCAIVWTTVGISVDAAKLAATLVSEGLAACVNVMGEMASVYRWEGQVSTSRERQLIIKTTLARLPALEARVHALHEYEVPEFIVVPVTGGSEKYLGWIRDSTAG